MKRSAWRLHVPTALQDKVLAAAASAEYVPIEKESLAEAYSRPQETVDLEDVAATESPTDSPGRNKMLCIVNCKLDCQCNFCMILLFRVKIIIFSEVTIHSIVNNILEQVHLVYIILVRILIIIVL